MDACSYIAAFSFIVSATRTRCVDDIMSEEGTIASISGLLADKDPRSHGEAREFAGKHNVFLISSHDVCIRQSANAPDGFARTTQRSEDGITVEIARRKRKLADAKESRQWADGVVSTFARSEGTDVPLCSAIREWELWDGKGVRKKLGKNGRGSVDGDGGRGATGGRLQF